MQGVLCVFVWVQVRVRGQGYGAQLLTTLATFKSVGSTPWKVHGSAPHTNSYSNRCCGKLATLATVCGQVEGIM